MRLNELSTLISEAVIKGVEDASREGMGGVGEGGPVRRGGGGIQKVEAEGGREGAWGEGTEDKERCEGNMKGN